MDLVVATRPGAGCTVVEVHGELDMATQPQLHDVLQALIGPGQVVIDLAGVGFMDSSALGTLVVMFKEIRAAGGRLCLAQVQPAVRTVLAVTSVDQVIDLYATVQAAEDSMRSGDGTATEQASLG
ncbi:STAS domain-containing protein [Actinoplanes sp. NPDC051494]|uniref:STAS domain-containing protein n=1 Tax=Actinoplanes sp. NPDC051494 TaxID=3363907 RepID=UPI0037A96B0F